MAKVKQVILLETDKLILIELFNYPTLKTPLMAQKALEQIERVKERLLNKYKIIEVFVSKNGAFRQIIKIEKKLK
ncbi:MAG: hypothetical protein ACT4ON_01000 [Bacteroidota bacterium]